MTDSRLEPASDNDAAPAEPGAAAPAPLAPAPAPLAPGPATPSAPMGLFRFAIEGRRAPGLFVAGWLATLVGVGAILIELPLAQGLPKFIMGFGGAALALLGVVMLGGEQAIERKGRVAYWGPSPLLVLVAAFLGSFVLATAVALPFELTGVRLGERGAQSFALAIQVAVVLGLLRLLVVGPGALSWREMGVIRDRGRALADLAYGAAFAVPVVVVTGLLASALQLVFRSTPESPLPPTGTPGGLLINLLLGAVIAPVYEELLFRGFATTAWARMTTPAVAIARTSILFAIAHVLTVSGDGFTSAAAAAIVGAGARLPIAIVLGWIFLRRGSLWASIGLHAAFNGLLIVIAEAVMIRGGLV